MKAIVTGGAGFIGSHVVDSLIEAGLTVVALDDLSGGSRDNVNPLASFVEGSILDHDLINGLFERHGFDYVFHLAAYAAEGLSHFIKRFNYQNNVVGSMNLIDAAVNHDAKCFVFTSSIAVYGANQLPMTEDMVPAPEDSYGIAKHVVERELAITHDIFGLPYIVFRPHNVYGARQNIGDAYRNVIGIFMNEIMQGRPLTIFGDGEQTRAFSDIGDVAPVIARSVFVPEAYCEIFNVGADEPYSVNRLAAEVAHAMGTTAVVRHLPPRHEVMHAYAAHDKASRVFGSRAGTGLRDGLTRMATWAREVGSRRSQPFRDIEIRRRLPSAWLEESGKRA